MYIRDHLVAFQRTESDCETKRNNDSIFECMTWYLSILFNRCLSTPPKNHRNTLLNKFYIYKRQTVKQKQGYVSFYTWPRRDLSTYVWMYVSTYIHICLSVSLSVHLSIYVLQNRESTCLPTHQLGIHPSSNNLGISTICNNLTR